MTFRPFSPGDVVIGPDPFHTDDPRLREDRRRPWLIVNTRNFPGHGGSYIVCALTSRRHAMEGFIDLEAGDWVSGGTHKPSQIDASTVITMKHNWISAIAGRLRAARLDAARRALKSFL